MNRATLQKNISTPIPLYGVSFKHDKAIAKIKTKVNIELHKDALSTTLPAGAAAKTYLNWSTMEKDGKELKEIYKAFDLRKKRKLNHGNFVWRSPNYTFYIQTLYRDFADRAKLSAYGFGTNIWDKKKTLRFHEGSHGLSFINYIKKTDLPKIKIFDGMPKADLYKELGRIGKELLTHQKNMSEISSLLVDCVGSRLPKPKLAQCPLPFHTFATGQQMLKQFPFDVFVGH